MENSPQSFAGAYRISSGHQYVKTPRKLKAQTESVIQTTLKSLTILLQSRNSLNRLKEASHMYWS